MEGCSDLGPLRIAGNEGLKGVDDGIEEVFVAFENTQFRHLFKYYSERENKIYINLNSIDLCEGKIFLIFPIFF